MRRATIAVLTGGVFLAALGGIYTVLMPSPAPDFEVWMEGECLTLLAENENLPRVDIVSIRPQAFPATRLDIGPEAALTPARRAEVETEGTYVFIMTFTYRVALPVRRARTAICSYTDVPGAQDYAADRIRIEGLTRAEAAAGDIPLSILPKRE